MILFIIVFKLLINVGSIYFVFWEIINVVKISFILKVVFKLYNVGIWYCLKYCVNVLFLVKGIIVGLFDK